MFGDLVVQKQNRLIEKVDFQIQNGSRYSSANSDGVVIISAAIARVFINDDSYFIDVPESAWDASFNSELSPREFLEKRIGSDITEKDEGEFKKLINDLVDAEFKFKSSNQR